MARNMPDTTEYLTADPGKRTFGSFSSASTETKAGSERSLEKSQGSTSELIGPLDDAAKERILLQAEHFAMSHGLDEHKDMIKKGALVAKGGGAFENLELLSEEDKQALRYERTHPWSQPWKMYKLVVVCSLAAALQGVRPFHPSQARSQCLQVRFIRWTNPSSTAQTCSSPVSLVSILHCPAAMAGYWVS